MRLPEFTAMESLYRSRDDYCHGQSAASHAAMVVPAIEVNDAPATVAPSPTSHTGATLSPQAGGGNAPPVAPHQGANPNGAQAPRFIYALGRVRCDSKPSCGKGIRPGDRTGREGEHRSTGDPCCTVRTTETATWQARKLCWVLMIEGLEKRTSLRAAYPADLDLLIEAVRPQPSLLDVDVVVGVRRSIASPELCNGLMVPLSCSTRSIPSMLIRSSSLSRDRKRLLASSSSQRRRSCSIGLCKWRTMPARWMSTAH